MKSILCPLAVILSIAISVTAGAENAPKQLESLTTTKNRVFQHVEITEITPAGIKIRHEGGIANVPFEELPPALQKQLGGFDPAAAEAYRNKLKFAAQEQEKEMDKAISEASQHPSPAQSGHSLPAAPAKTAANPKESKDPKDSKPVVIDQGALSANIVSYGHGIKKVEFKVRTNCAAKLEVHGVIPDEHAPTAHTDTFDVSPNIDFVREIWVYNNYSSDLFGPGGKRLDSESRTQKTHLSPTAPSLH